MDIRCGSCSKLFRVADEKIAGKGIRFKCTKCGEVITITKQDFEMDLLAREGGNEVTAVLQPTPAATPPQPSPTPSPPEPEAREYQPQASPPQEPDAREYKPPEAPQAGLEDFDFSEPHDAAQHAQEPDAGLGDFSFGDQAFQEQQETPEGHEVPSGEVQLSEDEEKAAEDAFAFPTELISEPSRKAAFDATSSEAQDTGSADAAAGGGEPSETTLDLSGLDAQAPDVASRPEPAPSRKTGPVFTPPERRRQEPPPPQEEELDLGAALSIPRMAGGLDNAGAGDDVGGMTSGATAAFPEPVPSNGEVHPLASGNVTGAITGVGCALPIVVMLAFGFGILAKFLPFLASLPFVHLIAAAGGGLFSIGIMIGILIAVLQAKAGRKLFFLVNILAGTLFGTVFGGGMMAVVVLASGAPLDVARISSGAINGGIMATLLSILLVIVRRIMMFTKTETFSAPLTGGQKAGLALSIVIILAAGYGQGTLTGKLEQAGQALVQQYPKEITTEGLTVVDATAYMDQTTGDLVITGAVQNSLSEPKPGWYLVVDVYDKAQTVAATVRMVNGVQILMKREFGLLQQRGKNIKNLKAQMALSVQAGEIPAKGRVPFEVHLMEPPTGATSFLPVLKKFDPAATFELMAAEMGEQ